MAPLLVKYNWMFPWDQTANGFHFFKSTTQFSDGPTFKAAGVIRLRDGQESPELWRAQLRPLSRSREQLLKLVRIGSRIGNGAIIHDLAQL